MKEIETGRVDLPSMHNSGVFRLLVAGRLGPDWKDQFDEMNVVERPTTDPRGISELTVSTADQAALLGVLGQLSDMQCTLLRVELVNEDRLLGKNPKIEQGTKEPI